MPIRLHRPFINLGTPCIIRAVKRVRTALVTDARAGTSLARGGSGKDSRKTKEVR
jgi:hypothetical protein